LISSAPISVLVLQQGLRSRLCCRAECPLFPGVIFLFCSRRLKVCSFCSAAHAGLSWSFPPAVFLVWSAHHRFCWNPVSTLARARELFPASSCSACLESRASGSHSVFGCLIFLLSPTGRSGFSLPSAACFGCAQFVSGDPALRFLRARRGILFFVST
jgi:hypothetical protein